MSKVRIAVLVFTLICCMTGLYMGQENGRVNTIKSVKTTNSKEQAKGETNIKDVSEPEVTVTESLEQLASDELAVDIKESSISQTLGTKKDDEKFEIPEIVIAEKDDKEDVKPVRKDTPKPVAVAMPTKSPAQYNVPTPTPFQTAPEDDEYIVYTKKGIDVSKWNGEIDWAQVKSAGVQFVMVRAGYRGAGTGKLVVDPAFFENVEGALANGIEVGVYFYSQAINTLEAKQEAALVVELCKNYNITYPIAYDLEEVAMNRIKNLTNKQLNDNARAFLDYIKASGYTPCMYGCKYYMTDIWDMSRFSDCFIWVAHFGVSQTSYKGHYDMWQYSETGRIPGISEYTDLNIQYIRVKKVDETEEPGEETEEGESGEETTDNPDDVILEEGEEDANLPGDEPVENPEESTDNDDESGDEEDTNVDAEEDNSEDDNLEMLSE